MTALFGKGILADEYGVQPRDISWRVEDRKNRAGLIRLNESTFRCALRVDPF